MKKSNTVSNYQLGDYIELKSAVHNDITPRHLPIDALKNEILQDVPINTGLVYKAKVRIVNDNGDAVITNDVLLNTIEESLNFVEIVEGTFGIISDVLKDPKVHVMISPIFQTSYHFHKFDFDSTSGAITIDFEIFEAGPGTPDDVTFWITIEIT